jgi:hypothetical protein
MIGPFTQEEFDTLKERINRITSFLPEGEMRYIWESVSKIRGKSEPQPCSCKSSAGLWTRAVNDLRDFIKDNSSE